MGYFTLKTGSNGQYYFGLHASNGENILQSEGYISKQSAENGIASVRANSQFDGRFDRRTSSSGQYYFVLKASNGEILGRSEMYSSRAMMELGVQSVKTNAPAAAIRDLVSLGNFS
jgi:uncharacterized protein YegP (UPF0339 family)